MKFLLMNRTFFEISQMRLFRIIMVLKVMMSLLIVFSDINVFCTKKEVKCYNNSRNILMKKSALIKSERQKQLRFP